MVLDPLNEHFLKFGTGSVLGLTPIFLLIDKAKRPCACALS